MMTNLQARLISLSLLAIAAAIMLASGGGAGLVGLIVLFACIWMFICEYRASDRVERANETRCRRCRHVLRDLSEPRCPECGEKI